MSYTDELSHSMGPYPLPARWSYIKPREPEALHGSELVYTDEQSLVADMKWASGILQHIARCRKKDICEIRSDRSGRMSIVCNVRPGVKAIAAMLRKDWESLKVFFPSHSFVPLVEALIQAMQGEPALADCYPEKDPAEAVRMINRFATALRRITCEERFRTALHTARRRCRDNTRALRTYLEWIFTQGKRQLVIRLDLSYDMDDRLYTGRPTDVTLDQAMDDLEKLLRYVRDNYPMSGYAWKLEYGLLSGYHFHLLLLLNGHIVRDGVGIGRMMGREWNERITEGRGRHHNCNAEKYRWPGTGLIHSSDADKMKVLFERVAPYLTKIDFWLRLEAGRRTFGRGTVPQVTRRSAHSGAGGSLETPPARPGQS